MSEVGSTAEEPIVYLTLRWRELDSVRSASGLRVAAGVRQQMRPNLKCHACELAHT